LASAYFDGRFGGIEIGVLSGCWEESKSIQVGIYIESLCFWKHDKIMGLRAVELD
jgi:hypothetical protein